MNLDADRAAADWIDKLQGAVDAASGEARGAFFYYAGFGLYAVVPALFVVFHVYALLQLVFLARRIGLLKLALRRRRGPAAFRQRVLVSPFAISQRLFGEPRGLAPQLLLRLSIWLTLVLI